MQAGRPTLPGSDIPIMFDNGNGLNFNIPGMGGMNPSGGMGTQGVQNIMPPMSLFNDPNTIPVDHAGMTDTAFIPGAGDAGVNPTTGFDPNSLMNPNPNSTINPNAGNSGVPGLTTGAGGFLGNTDIPALTKQLDEIFGKGMGGAIVNSITNQYHPEIAQALIAAMQPALTQGRNNIRESFGASGGSGGSPLALGLSNFESQATLGENEILANAWQQAQNNSTGILQSLLRPAEAFEANKSSVFDQISNVMKILSGLGLTGGEAGGSIGKILQDLLKKVTGQKGGSPAGGPQQGPSTGGSQGQGGYKSFPITDRSIIGNPSGDTFQQWLDQIANGNLDIGVPFQGDTGIIGATPWDGSNPGFSDPNNPLAGIFGNDVTPMPTQGGNDDPLGLGTGSFDPFGSGGLDNSANSNNNMGIDPGLWNFFESNGYDPYYAGGENWDLGDMFSGLGDLGGGD